MTKEQKNTEDIDSEAQLLARIADYEAKLKENADLTTSFRHDINNPLTGVLGQAQLLLREELSEKARKRAKTIEQLAMRMRDIVAELRVQPSAKAAKQSKAREQ